MNSSLRNSYKTIILLPQEITMDINQLSSQIIRAAINVQRFATMG